MDVKKFILILGMLFFILLAVFDLVYFVCGHDFIQMMYEQTCPVDFFNTIIEQQAKFDLQFFFDKGDRALYEWNLKLIGWGTFLIGFYLLILELFDKKIIRFQGLIITISILTALSCGELFLRNKHYLWTDPQSRNPLMCLHDETLGWRGKPGRYIIKGYSEEQEDFYMTILEDGSRATSQEMSPKENQIVFLGDSVTWGQALDDDQTFCWKLQKRLEKWQIKNYGMGGYGTYQNYLFLKTYLEESGVKPQLVVLAHTSWQTMRNVAPSIWMRDLSRENFRDSEKRLKVPFAYLDKDENLVTGEMSEYTSWPFRQQSAWIGFLESVYYKFRVGYRMKNFYLLEKKIILEMKRMCEKKGVKFLYISLIRELDYSGFGFETNKCMKEDYKWGDSRYTVKNEGHPNEVMHDYWTNCIEKKIRDIVK